MTEEINPYPLRWPEVMPRSTRRNRSDFAGTFEDARKDLLSELVKLGAKSPVITSDIEDPEQDDWEEPGDSGVAVYFMFKGKQMMFACDKWVLVKDNMRAIQKTIEAIRSIAHWGASDPLELVRLSGFLISRRSKLIESKIDIAFKDLHNDRD